MTIADAFNEITIAQGGTPNYSGTIASAIDALNDALAGSDQPAETTIEGAVRLLGQHIGGGSLSPATADTLGGVKIGEGINVTEDGTISAAGGGTSIVVNDVEGTLDKTWKEIYDVVSVGGIGVINSDFGENGYSSILVAGAELNQGSYIISTVADPYVTDSENGYPTVG